MCDYKFFQQKLFIPSFPFKNMADNRINMPSGFGGLMRFNEDYASKISFKPAYIILFIVAIIALRVFFGFYFS